MGVPQIPRLPLSPPLLAQPGRAWDGSMLVVDGRRPMYSIRTLLRTRTCRKAVYPNTSAAHLRVHSPWPASLQLGSGELESARRARTGPPLHINTHIDSHISRCTWPAWRVEGGPEADADAHALAGRSIEA